MFTRQEIIDRARQWIGTPFIHQARVLGVGCDCAGLIVDIGNSVCLIPTERDVEDYSANPNPKRMKEILEHYLIPISKSKLLPGDILWFWIKKDTGPQHLGIYTYDNTVIHAHATARGGRVVEHRLGRFWRDRIVSVYRYPGVID